MGKLCEELQEHLGTREEISISRVAIFPLFLTWDHTHVNLRTFFDKEFQKASGKYEKQGQLSWIKIE